MVLQRTIENLREKPKHEREAVAFWIAAAVVLMLFAGWAIFFFRSLNAPDLSQVNNAYNQVAQQVSATQNATEPPPGSTGWVSMQTATSASDMQFIQEGNADTIYPTQ